MSTFGGTFSIELRSRRAPRSGRSARPIELRTASSRSSPHQSSHSDEVVRRQSESKHPVNTTCPSVPGLPQCGHGLHPPENFFDALPFALTDHVSGMTCRPSIDGAVLPLRSDVRCVPEIAHSLDECHRVVTLVASDRGLSRRQALYHGKARFTFTPTRRSRHATIYDNAMSVLHQHVTGVAKLRLGAVRFPVQARFRVRRRLMGLIASLLPAKIDSRILRSFGVISRTVLGLEALVTGPRFDQFAVY